MTEEQEYNEAVAEEVAIRPSYLNVLAKISSSTATTLNAEDIEIMDKHRAAEAKIQALARFG